MSDTDIPGGIIYVQPDLAFDTFNVLLYGPGGSGKTIGATSAPGPVLVLNSEGPGGLAYARSLGRDIREVKFTGAHILRPFCELVKAGADGAKTVVIDTVAKMYEAILDDLGGKKPQIQHYGQANKTIKDLVLFLRDQPVNVVLVCHEKIDEGDGDRIIRPLTGGQQLPEILIGEVDVVAYCGEVAATEDSPRRWVGQFVQERGRRAKDRSGALGAWRDLDLSEWLEVYSSALRPDDSDLPFAVDGEQEQGGSGERGDPAGVSPSTVGDSSPDTPEQTELEAA
jgi:hypothetical protein